jgi:LPXTG-motif cell wall-anchored protein
MTDPYAEGNYLYAAADLGACCSGCAKTGGSCGALGGTQTLKATIIPPKTTTTQIVATSPAIQSQTTSKTTLYVIAAAGVIGVGLLWFLRRKRRRNPRRNPRTFTRKGERMYRHIKAGYGSSPRAKEIAARTVYAAARRGKRGLMRKRRR